MESLLKVGLVGAGGLGSLFGGLLAAAGENVVLVNPRRKDHIAAINAEGLSLIDGAGKRIIRCKATTDPEKAGVVDLLILTTKAQHTEKAMKRSLPMIGKDTTAISLQNGIGCAELMGEIIGAERVVGGATMQGGNYLGPGKVAHVNNLPTEIGEFDGKNTERIERIAEIFNRGGIETVVSDDIRRVIWRKALYCVGGDAIGAICRFNVGELFDVAAVKEIINEAIEEAAKVALAEEIQINPRDITWAKDMLNKVFATRRSESPAGGIQTDIIRGKKTDVDFKNGAIVRLGRKNRIPTPVNKTLWAAVKGLERNCRD